MVTSADEVAHANMVMQCVVGIDLIHIYVFLSENRAFRHSQPLINFDYNTYSI